MYTLIASQVYWDEAACEGHEYRDLRVSTTKNDSITPSSLIKIYPNPASDELILDWWSTQNENGEISIVNMMGQEILDEKALSNTGHVFIDINFINPGTYIVTLQNQTGVLYKTIIVIIK